MATLENICEYTETIRGALIKDNIIYRCKLKINKSFCLHANEFINCKYYNNYKENLGEVYKKC